VILDGTISLSSASLGSASLSPGSLSSAPPGSGPLGSAALTSAGDRLDDELDVVARLPLPPDPSALASVLAYWRPRLILVNASLDAVDYWLLRVCRDHRVRVLVRARPAYGLLGSTHFRRFGGTPWLPLRWPGQRRSAALCKRFLDIALVIVSAPIVVPLMLVVGLLVSLDGPPLYVQERVGKAGRRFRLVKFRTMRVRAELTTGPTLATPEDPRMTRLGRVLRRYRVDELPQLWNVLLGQMSLVGPRPERPELIRQFHGVPHYDLRHLVRPGLTGIAQLTGGYGASVEEKLRCDLLYVSCWSLRLDLRLLALTVRDLLRGFPRG
jgi:lipopolysaccharide/colanic/teichoic acid biosynthesis glycosyltransferase